MKQKHTLLVCITLLIILLTVSCQSSEEPPTSSPLPIATGPATPDATATAIPEPMPSATTAPETATPFPPSATPTPPIITLTPLPTFAAAELEMAIAELLANPMNCDVPCWWGAIPNETTAFEVQQFLNRYQFTDYQRDANQVPDYIELWFGYDETVNQFDFRVMYSFENIVLKTVIAEYSPPPVEILRRFGPPEEVWLETMSFERETLPFRLNLVYLQKGMAVGYVVDGDIQDNLTIGCFANEETGHLRLIVPDTATSYKDFPIIFEEDRRYLPLEEATDLTIDDFMQRFLDPTQPHCLETPVDLWE